MPGPYLIGIILTVLAVALFGAVALLGAWIDGRRQALLDRGLHPTTTPEGNVVDLETPRPSGQ